MPSNAIQVQVQSRSAQSKITVSDEGKVKVYVTAAPTDGEANDAVLKLLAKRLGIAPSSLAILSGQTSRTKKIDLGALTAEEATRRVRESS
ncbi:MAG: DUF167 domain-containing protein [Chthonomonas sp.]|nr:DUF167 domain-containing protein [Chthonomonas sp.]